MYISKYVYVLFNKNLFCLKLFTKVFLIYFKGTFGVYEKASSVLEFVKEALDDGNLTFSLKTSTGQNLIKHSNVTLFDLKLIPAAILNFDPEISKQSYLKSEILILAQPLR